MSEDDYLYVDCDKHGRGLAVVVCRHLCDDKDHRPLGFIENSSEPGDKQAWCHQCEEVFTAQGGMTDEFRKFNDMALVCESCYELIKTRHSQTN